MRGWVERRLRLPRGSVVALPNAVSPEFEALARAKSVRGGGGERRLRIGFVGRDERRKNLRGLIAASHDMGEAGALTLQIVGNVRAEPVEASWAEFHGPITDAVTLWNFYRSCDALAVPSFMEGIPTVILEAMAASIPVIATDVGGVRDVVSDETGILVAEPSDSALRMALAQFMRLSHDERQRRGANGRARVLAEFTWRRVGSLTRQVLAAVARRETTVQA